MATQRDASHHTIFQRSHPFASPFPARLTAIQLSLNSTIFRNFASQDISVDDRLMVEIVQKYMQKMGIADTPYIIVRHLDKDYPHCHIVFSRIDNHAETISDKNDFNRNRAVCLDLTKEYGLHISEGKKQTNVNRLRGAEKVRYEIFNAVEAVWNDGSVHTIEQFEARLKGTGVGIEYKRGSNELEGLWYTRKGKRFAASKIDRRFSLGNISKHLAANKPRHPQSQWLYADGTIVPISSYKGVKFTPQQIKDYVAGHALRVDGCQGAMPTVWIKFNQQRKTPGVYSSNPDLAGQAASQSQNYGTRLAPVSAAGTTPPQEGFTNGSALPDDFKLWLSRHPGLTIEEALHRYREEQKAKRRRQGPNYIKPNAAEGSSPRRRFSSNLINGSTVIW